MKKMLFVSIIVALASQVNIGLMHSDFRVSAGIIMFAIFIYYYNELKPVQTGILSGTLVSLLRLIIYYLRSGSSISTIPTFYLEIFFYIFYAVIYSLIVDKANKENLNNIFIVLVISDLFANIIEVIIRTNIETNPFPWEIISTLFLVAIVRSTIVWLVLNLSKYYRMLLMKEEHERRYKRLLMLTSQLRTEMFWLEKNMEDIENLMSHSYKLYELINENKERNSWSNRAITIAKDIHEIKKENNLVVRGIKEIIEFQEIKDEGMYLEDILSILYYTINREIKRQDKNIKLDYTIEKDFYTAKHYYLVSIFRNLIMNSMDAIPKEKKDAIINIQHRKIDKFHHFIISDNGSGITNEGLDHIFSPGYSTKINYSTGEVNRGLGLTIIQYIVEVELDGKVNVVSKEGQGTRFNISIPVDSLEVVFDDEDFYS